MEIVASILSILAIPVKTCLRFENFGMKDPKIVVVVALPDRSTRCPMIPSLTSKEHFRARVWLAAIAALVMFESSCSRVSLPDNVMGIDKLGHFLLYGLLATHFHRAGFTRGRLWLSVLAMSLFGATDELHQHFTPGRSMDILDWVSDTLGSALAISLHDHFRLYRRLLDWRIA